MNVLVTGANGFIGKNLCVQLLGRREFNILPYTRASTILDLQTAINNADFICHLAGVNRPEDLSDFARDNTDFTEFLCDALKASGKCLPIIFASSQHVTCDIGNSLTSMYGKSKLAAEQVLLDYSKDTGAPVYIFRLPHVIGKWCRPNYNSVVATFCNNIARDLPIQISDQNYPLKVVYIDDLVNTFIKIMKGAHVTSEYGEAHPTFMTTVGELASQISAFKNCRSSLMSEKVGVGLTRALYATYISYLPKEKFVYSLQEHRDPRGVFVEVLKTKDSGQFSYFTASPGVTRGCHYHHSKAEKFLVMKGQARFRFKQVITNEYYEIFTAGDVPKIVETIPGWVHDITNIGMDEMIVMLWANEVFDNNNPDTYAASAESVDTVLEIV